MSVFSDTAVRLLSRLERRSDAVEPGAEKQERALLIALLVVVAVSGLAVVLR